MRFSFLTVTLSFRVLPACFVLAAMDFFVVGSVHALAPVASDETMLADSVLPLSARRDTVGSAKVRRSVISAAEAGEELAFSIALRMPDLAGLNRRIGNKERISEDEMEARYRPDRKKYESVSRWLQQHGFRITVVDETHTNIFARGRITDIARVFKVEFGRVTTADGEYTSALSAPVIPAAFAHVILAVNGLQPQFCPRHVSAVNQSPSAGTSGGSLPTGQFAVTPANIVETYKVPKDLDGAGQTIALIEESGVIQSDLTTFWSAMGVSQKVSNLTVVGDSTVSTDASLFGEATLDVEWAGALAPAAKLRVYVVSESFDATNIQILNDVVKNRLPITVLSISFAALEADLSSGSYQASSQIYSQLAAAGVSVFASSGDTGTNAATAGGGGSHNANYPLIIAYPASDPSVTGVGGSTLSLDQNSVSKGEVVWSYIATGGANGTGGGVSTLFSKPSWQYGGPVLAGSAMRCVPDVAAVADFGAIYQKGTWGTIGGTSLAAPIWGALCALINQSRASAGLKPVGLLNTYLYSSSLTGGFNDIASGMNGAYRAGSGYDLCTGLGTPNLTNLISVLGNAAGVNIASQPADQAVTLGQPATLTVAGNAAAGALNYQWYFNGVAIAGATGASYTIPTTTLANVGSYDVSVTGKAGKVGSMPASLMVNYISAITLQPQPTTLSVGQNLVVSVSVTGYPTPTYQWQKSTNAGALWSNVSDGTLTSGSTTSRLSFGPATQDLSGVQFRVVIRNASGTVTSSAATVMVTAATESSVVYQVTTLAGKPSFGSENGASSVARFNTPTGVAMAESGNLYVADSRNNLIRKITPAGVVSTFAGGGSRFGSSLDGIGTLASFNFPELIAVDAAENVYVGEVNSNLVRKITPAGLVTTLAGNGSSGISDGVGKFASFHLRSGSMAVTREGTVYVADGEQGYDIRKITSSGVVTTLAGQVGVSGYLNGTGTGAKFGRVRGMCVDASGNLFVADTDMQRIRKVTPAGVVTSIAGNGIYGHADGTGEAAKFFNPAGITIDGSGNLYVADTSNQCIRKVTQAGVVTTIAGQIGTWVNKLIYCPIDPNFVVGTPGHQGCVDGAAGNAMFSNMLGLTIDSGGNLYVADTDNDVIRKLSTGEVVTTYAGVPPANINGKGSAATFSNVQGVAIDANRNAYVVDTQNYTIRKITPEGVVTTFAGQPGIAGSRDGPGSIATFSKPMNIAIDRSGNFYVTDYDNFTIRKITPAGLVSTLAGKVEGTGYADGVGDVVRFCNLGGIATDQAGNVYVADRGNSLVRKITPAGVVSTLAGTWKKTGYADGPASSALFNFDDRSGLAVDSAGNVFLADWGNAAVRKITPAGVVSTFAGGVSGYSFPINLADGVGTAAMFSNAVAGLTIDKSDNLYLVDHNGNVRKITPAGVVTTVAGAKEYIGLPCLVDDIGSKAGFNFPVGIAVDDAGRLIVAEEGNKVVRALTPRSAAFPYIANNPESKSVAQGASATLSASTIGTSLTYQWYRDGLAISGASSATYTIGNVSSATVGSYTLIATNSYGRVSSEPAVISLNGREAPAITTQPVRQTAAAGGAVTFSVVASGTSLTYQWYRNGAAIAGATSSTFTVSSVSTASAGSYSVLVASPDGSMMSTSASLVLVTAKLSNLSVRTPMAAGQTLIVGAVVNGPSRTVLFRAGGPALNQYGLRGMVDPRLELYTGGSSPAAVNDNWPIDLASVTGSVGAFPYDPGSKDAALSQSLTGSFTLQAKGTGAGTILVEMYDVTGNNAEGGMINGSARNIVGTGDNVLILGFYIAGTGSKTLLVRGIGPGLAQYNVAGFLADPKIQVYDSKNALVASNDNWDPNLATTFASVGAFSLAPTSKDAALLVSLPAGTSYTVQVTGADGGTGDGIVELYEVP